MLTAFHKKNGQRRCNYIVLGSGQNKKIKMLEFLLTTYYMWCLVDTFFNSLVFQENCELLFSLTCSFIRMLQISHRGISRRTKKRAQSFNFTLRFLDDVLSLNNSRKIGDYVDHIYSIELEINATTDIMLHVLNYTWQLTVMTG